METAPSLKDDTDLAAQLAMAGVSNVWSQAAPLPAPQAHMSMTSQNATDSQLINVHPPPAHAHPSSTNMKPPDSFLDKNLLEAAAFMDGKTIKSAESTAPSDNQSSIPWAIQQQLLQQYGHFMLEKMINKHNDPGTGGGVATATVTTDTEELPQSLVTNSTNNQAVISKGENATENIEAQRDVYRRMLNYSMSSTLAQQYYLSQYGYNYLQDRTLFSKADSGGGASATTTTTVMSPNQVSIQEQLSSQLPSIDSVLLNLSTKKTNGKPSPVATSLPGGAPLHPSSTSIQHNVQAYGLQALANAAIGADHKQFGDMEGERKDGGQKSELEDVTDTDSSNMSPSDSSTSQIMSPPRNTYSHIPQDNQHLSIPAAHSHQYQSIYQSKSAMGTLPSIQHFSAMGKAPISAPPVQKMAEPAPPPPLQLPVSSGIKPSDLVAAAMKLKVEPSEEKELADRAIQEQIAAHQLNAVQQQVQDLTAGVLASSNIDAAALLAKLQASNLETELHRFYDADALQGLQQQEPMELTSDMSPGKTGSRRKSRGRPTSIESLRDPLARQSSTSSLGGNTSVSGDCEDRTYDCEICGKQFSHNDRLRRHRKIHTAEKPYKCDICGKGFKEKCNLKHHRFIHTGEKPYKCDTCGKSFNQRSSLKTHQKVHTGEKPFRCELCDKPFAQKYLLRQHMKKHIELNMAPTQQ